MGLERRHEAAIACLDHRRGGGVGADDIKPFGLPFAEGLPRLLMIGGGVVHHRVSGQDVRTLLDIGRLAPAVMEHRLGQPLVGVVLQKIVEEGECCVLRHHMAAGIGPFQPADDRRRIHHRVHAACIVGEVKGRQQFHLGPRQVLAQAMGARHQAIGNAAIT